MAHRISVNLDKLQSTCKSVISQVTGDSFIYCEAICISVLAITYFRDTKLCSQTDMRLQIIIVCKILYETKLQLLYFRTNFLQ